ncbi:hypothetical protein GCM10010349_29290 [Streptomyces flavofungini]|nr:hypothetical protein GCM10010349_29290 [Streptomyces flavofungini]
MCRGSGPGTRRWDGGHWEAPRRARTRPVNLEGVNPKTRNRIMAGVLVLMFVVVALAAALGQ